MTHDERISSYIDNELSIDQEQEFLISLAASEGLRKSFRSELVLKKVLHRDEVSTTPPRRLRGAVFATLGLGGAALAPQKSSAHQAATQQAAIGNASRGLVKTFFATKMTTLATAAGISASALVGYGVHSVVNTPATQPQSAQVVHVVHSVPAPTMSQHASQTDLSNPSLSTASATHTPEVIHPAVKHHASQTPVHSVPNASEPANPVDRTTGTGGPVVMNPPKIGH